MANVSASLAKSNFAAVLDRVEHGETLVITRHGKPVAEIRPSQREKKSEREQFRDTFQAFRERARKVSAKEIRALRDAGRE
jgi:prevent-host-death family protein